MKPEISDTLELFCVNLQIYSFFGTVGGLTRFRQGISTRAQRGWFISWPLIGMIYGALASGASRYEDTSRQTVKIAAVPQENSTWDGLHEDSNTAQLLGALVLGAATIGGVVAMVQQYLHLIEC
jgi:hypothetical protein